MYKMRLKLILTIVLYCTLLWTENAFAGEATTQKAVPVTNTTQAPPVETTPKPPPKVNVTGSALCKKCICNTAANLLDCSNKQMTNWFTDDEWNTLQNGDFTFETIKLEHNNLTQVPQVRTYPVKNLYLGFNQIVNITKGAFQNLSELAKLDLSHNKLTSKMMDPDIFKGKYSPADYLPLDNMRELDLGYNEMHNLDPDLFEHLPKLEVLILCKNQFQVIDHLTETAIAGCKSLKTLDISYMELSDLPDNFLHGPRDLETLILTGNLLTELPDNIELGINLKQLVLDENPMADFTGENVFPLMKSLEYLSISYLPELTKIGAGGLHNLPKLSVLVASNNPKFSSIDAAAFAKNTSNPMIFDYPPLKKLYLHNNNLTVLSHDLIQRWDQVDPIDLRFNPWGCDCTNSWMIHTLMTQINTTTPVLTQSVKCATPAAWKDLAVMELNSEKKLLVCTHESYTENLMLVGLVVGILVGIPLTIGTLILYRRGCFGLLNRGNSAASRALYNRASFTDDFHI